MTTHEAHRVLTREESISGELALPPRARMGTLRGNGPRSVPDLQPAAALVLADLSLGRAAGLTAVQAAAVIERVVREQEGVVSGSPRRSVLAWARAIERAAARRLHQP